MHLLLSGLDRTSTKGLVFVDKHARHGVLNALITRPIWVLCNNQKRHLCPCQKTLLPFHHLFASMFIEQMILSCLQ